MSDAPKVIWIEHNPASGIPPFPSWNDEEAHESAGQTLEYVRVDLVQELLNRITELEETISGRYEQMEEEYED